MASESIERILEAFSTFEREGLEGILPLVHPDAHVFADSSVLNAGTFHGPEGFATWAQGWLEAWQEVSYEPLEFNEVTESLVVLTINQRAKGAGSGIEMEEQYTWLIEIRDDMIFRFHLYPDRDAALEAANRFATKPGEAPT